MMYDKINLLPKEIRWKRAVGQRNIAIVSLLTVYVFAVIVVFASLSIMVNSANNDLTAVKQKRAILRAKISQYSLFEKRERELDGRKELLKKAKDDEVKWSGILYKLSLLLPPQVWLSNFKVDEEQLVMSGSSIDMQGVSGSILQMLNLEDLTDKVVLRDIRKDKDTQSLIFNINTNIRDEVTQANSVQPPKQQGGR